MIERLWILESCKSSPDRNSRKLKVCGSYTNITSYFEQEYQDFIEIFDVEQTTLKMGYSLLPTTTSTTPIYSSSTYSSTMYSWTSNSSTGKLIESTRKSTTKKSITTKSTTTKSTTKKWTAKKSTKPKTTRMTSDNNKPLIQLNISLVTGRIFFSKDKSKVSNFIISSF